MECARQKGISPCPPPPPPPIPACLNTTY
jgi:hypothetical protein